MCHFKIYVCICIYMEESCNYAHEVFCSSVSLFQSSQSKETFTTSPHVKSWPAVTNIPVLERPPPVDWWTDILKTVPNSCDSYCHFYMIIIFNVHFNWCVVCDVPICWFRALKSKHFSVKKFIFLYMLWILI